MLPRSERMRDEDMAHEILFRHKGLRTLYYTGRKSGISPQHARKLQDILALLQQSRGPEGMDLPGLRLHPLKGALAGHFAVAVSGNWRVTFRFEDGVAVDIDYVDYH